jgi:hypothetical protein
MRRSQEFARTVVLACSVEYSEEGLFAVDEAFFDICVFDSWEPLEGEFVLDKSDLRGEARGWASRIRERPLCCRHLCARGGEVRRTVRHDLPTARKGFEDQRGMHEEG